MPYKFKVGQTVRVKKLHFSQECSPEYRQQIIKSRLNKIGIITSIEEESRFYPYILNFPSNQMFRASELELVTPEDIKRYQKEGVEIKIRQLWERSEYGRTQGGTSL